MKRYEFSVNSFNKLKEFMKVVESTSPSEIEDNEIVARWKKILPVDTELIQKLREHTYTDGNVREDNETKMEIDQTLEETNKSPVNEVETGSQNANIQDDCPETKLLQIKELILNEEYDEIVPILSLYPQSQLEYIFEGIKQLSNVVTFGKFVANCNNSPAAYAYCNIILTEQISNGSQTISETFEDFFEKYASIISPALVKCFISLSEDSKISRECINALEQLSEEYKNQILSTFIQQSTQLGVLHLSIIDNLLHSKMDLLSTKNLLNLLTQSSSHLTGSKQFGLLLQNIILKCSKYLYPLAEHMKSLVNMVQDIFKIKLLKMLQTLDEENRDNTFSQTMQF